MKRLLKHGDGRLKTGRLSLVVFITLLLCGALFFKAGQQLDTVLVEVKHQFEPQLETPPTDIETPQAEAASPSEVQPVAEVKPQEQVPQEQAPQVAEQEAEPQPAAVEEQESAAMEPAQQLAAVDEVDERVMTEQLSTQPIDQVEEPVQNRADHLTPVANDKPLSLDSEQYFKLMQQWAASGNKGAGGADAAIPLEVENLHQYYALFQMKVIAVNVKGHLFDLTDGSRLPQQALDDYSSTVIAVDQPWQHWQDGLQRAKFKRHDIVQVRYYMYPFVRNAIYARCQQGFDWCKQQGLIAETTQPTEVDIMGRTFEIQRNGGGHFGVFVPQQLTTAAGQRIAISTAAFAGQADITALQHSGLL